MSLSLSVFLHTRNEVDVSSVHLLRFWPTYLGMAAESYELTRTPQPGAEPGTEEMVVCFYSCPGISIDGE